MPLQPESAGAAAASRKANADLDAFVASQLSSEANQLESEAQQQEIQSDRLKTQVNRLKVLAQQFSNVNLTTYYLEQLNDAAQQSKNQAKRLRRQSIYLRNIIRSST